MNGALPTFDPAGLSPSQRAGLACADCGKALGALVQVGTFPDGGMAMACADHEIGDGE